MSKISRDKFKVMSPPQQLDLILSLFVKNIAFWGNITDGEIIKALFIEEKSNVNDNTSSRVVEILQKLCKDGYLYNHKDTSKYSLTFDGRYFYNEGKGGYCQMHSDIALERERLKNLELDQIEARKHQTNLQIQMNFLTLVVAVGTFVSAVYYLIQLYDGVNPKPHPCFVWALAGVCIATLILVVVLHNPKKTK